MQVYAYFTGKGKCTPAIKRAIIEEELIEEYHWLPQDIKRIPYKELQMMYLIRRQKHQSQNESQQLHEKVTLAQQANRVAQSSGQAKRF